MLNSDVYDHPVRHLELIETHISWVILTGDFAYKIKKPVNFGFLDFSTLERRYVYCKQELRLNRRLAPDIYLDVVAIVGTPKQPVISGHGVAFEYAVKMVQFPQSAQLDNRLTAGELKIEDMDAIACMIADFHSVIPVAGDSMSFGSKALIYQPIKENFSQIYEHLETEPYIDLLNGLQQWSRLEFNKLESLFEQRKRDGFVRECHGDMYLHNLLWLDGKPIAFDCIEFNPVLRWIDVISEVAFLVMDLQERQQYRFANHVLNSYLEVTGDYAGLQVLPFYLCYRAMVRAKVDALRIQQKSICTQDPVQSLSEFKSYLELATSYTRQAKPRLIIMRGLSASGKSTVSQQLLEQLDNDKDVADTHALYPAGTIRIRSDIERKRLFAIPVTESASGEIDAGIYSAQASRHTYAKLLELATQVISAGYGVIIDAAFLNYAQRKPFQALAASLGIVYLIVEVTASAEVLRQRIVARKNDVSDAGLAVLEHQLLRCQPLHTKEKDNLVSVDTSQVMQVDALVDMINSLDS